MTFEWANILVWGQRLIGNLFWNLRTSAPWSMEKQKSMAFPCYVGRQQVAGWWFQFFFTFFLYIGEMIQFDLRIFFRSVVKNHQL